MFIIAIDGPVGSGKSTIAKHIAKKAGFAYLDTGAMYRAIGWKAYITKIDLLSDKPKENPLLSPFIKGGTHRSPPLEKGGEGGFEAGFSEEFLDKICATTQLDMELEDGHLRVVVDGKDISSDIRSPEISRMASAVSSFVSVRKHLVRMQREIGHRWAKRYGGVVIEGRDIGTVVFPDTPFKFYIDADIQERGKRRWKELQDKGMNVGLDETILEVMKRDEHDQCRVHDPLRKAEDAIVIDTTGHSVEEVAERILSVVNQKSN